LGKKVLLLVGTKKGGFILDGDVDRTRWELGDPIGPGWPMYHMSFDETTGTIYAGGGNEWFGASVWRSTDLGKTWTQSSEGLNYGEGGPDIKAVWNVTPGHGRLYAGVEPAGLFRSDDGGVSWSHVSGLRDHPSHENWMPGGGGLCLHSIVPHPSDPKQTWVGISAVGTFHTQDGGETWTTQNKNVRADFYPDNKYPEYGQCVHALVMAAGRPDRIYQQNHCGVYRSDDGGAGWEEITEGLPSDFGFPMAAHPHDPDTAYVIPLDPEGRFMHHGCGAIWRTRDAGRRWERLSSGLPVHGAYLGVLRQAMAVDSLDRAGVYFGTGSGQVFGSRDEGESWFEIAAYLPPISSVAAVVVD
jgi:photosystem II stability/assembly factor-like uncharacterized protein